MSEQIKLSLIYRSNTLRPLDRQHVKGLMVSMNEIGLLNPILVRRAIHHNGGQPIDAYDIIAGGHRFETARALQWRTIECTILDHDSAHVELAEIDENLIRLNLSPAQEAAAMTRRKELYEMLHPETKHGGDRKTNQVAESATRFTQATAEKIGRSERTVRQIVAQGRALGPDLHRVVGTSLDKTGELEALSRLSKPERATLIDLASHGNAVSARPRPHKFGEKVERSRTEEEQYALLNNVWLVTDKEVLEHFLDDKGYVRRIRLAS